MRTRQLTKMRSVKLGPLVYSALSLPCSVVGFADRARAVTVMFQNQPRGYNGAHHAGLQSLVPEGNLGLVPALGVDGEDVSGGQIGVTAVVLRFDDIFGPAIGQILNQSTIDSASNSINVTNPGSGFAARWS